MTNLQNSAGPVLAIALTLMLAACANRVPLSETKPVPSLLQPAVAGVRPAWAGRMDSGEFVCEQGNRVDIQVDGDDVDLKWKGRTYKMTPVATSTGALRYENRGDGMVWIQIPSKSMLLNSKIGQQLANNCTNR